MIQSHALPIVESWKERARELRLDAHAVTSPKDKSRRLHTQVAVAAMLAAAPPILGGKEIILSGSIPRGK
jgi:hypothetical protein